DRKLFLGLESTNQGMHRRQPGTVLSTGGCPRHSGNVLTPTAAVGSSAAPFTSRHPVVRLFSCRMQRPALIFMTRGERWPRSWEFYPGALRITDYAPTEVHVGVTFLDAGLLGPHRYTSRRAAIGNMATPPL